MNRLREENAALLENVAELERRKAGGLRESGGVIAMVPRASLVNLQSELDASKALVAQKDILASRIKSVSQSPLSIFWVLTNFSSNSSRYSPTKQMNLEW